MFLQRLRFLFPVIPFHLCSLSSWRLLRPPTYALTKKSSSSFFSRHRRLPHAHKSSKSVVDGVKARILGGSRLKGSPSSNTVPIPTNFHSCMWTWLLYRTLDFGRKGSPTRGGAPKNAASLEEITMGPRSPFPPHLARTSRPLYGEKRAHL